MSELQDHKKEFWDILAGPVNKGCWNCKNRRNNFGAEVNGCELYDRDDCFGWFGCDTTKMSPGELDYAGLHESYIVLGHWEWDGKTHE